LRKAKKRTIRRGLQYAMCAGPQPCVRAILRSLEPQSRATFWRACRHSPDSPHLSTIAKLADKMHTVDPLAMASVEQRRRFILVRTASFHALRRAFPAGPD